MASDFLGYGRLGTKPMTPEETRKYTSRGVVTSLTTGAFVLAFREFGFEPVLVVLLLLFLASFALLELAQRRQ